MADIVLRDRSGNPVEYPEIERIKLNTTDGETVEFVDPALIPESVEKTIDPDFSGGNIVETPEAGTMFSKVTVNKPATLDPQYIAEGVNIAGIVGTLAAGGGGTAKVASGTFSGVSGAKAITHDLGVIPDFIIVCSNTNKTMTSGKVGALFGWSSAYCTSHSVGQENILYKYNGSAYAKTYVPTKMDKLTSTATGLSNVNETSFTVPSIMDSNHNYFWLAVAGLT